MPYLYLIGALLALSTLSVLGAGYNRKNADKKNVTAVYNAMLCVFASITWGVIYIFDFSFEPKALLYSLGFGVCFAIVMIGMINALAKGPTSLTALIQQLSLIGATVWGFAFWNTWQASKAPLVLSGLALVVISLALCLYSGKERGGMITLSWLVNVALVFVANAGCSIIQKSEQIAFDGKHGSMFMFFSVLIATVICGVAFMFSKKVEVKSVIKSSWVFPFGAGVCSALGNMFVVLLATTPLSPNLIYPAIAVGCLAIASCVSAFIFKEKLAWWQWVGIAVGAVAVALLSIS